jgi:hypothetical protein
MITIFCDFCHFSEKKSSLSIKRQFLEIFKKSQHRTQETAAIFRGLESVSTQVVFSLLSRNAKLIRNLTSTRKWRKKSLLNPFWRMLQKIGRRLRMSILWMLLTFLSAPPTSSATPPSVLVFGIFDLDILINSHWYIGSADSMKCWYWICLFRDLQKWQES